MAKIIPVKNNIYVLPLEYPEKVGSLFVPEEVREKRRAHQGIVHTRGPESEFRVGDHVLFSGYSGDEIIVEGIGKVIVMDESYIEAIIDDSSPDDILFPVHLIDEMIERTIGNMLVLGYDSKTINDFKERLLSFIHDHLFAELQF